MKHKHRFVKVTTGPNPYGFYACECGEHYGKSPYYGWCLMSEVVERQKQAKPSWVTKTRGLTRQ